MYVINLPYLQSVESPYDTQDYIRRYSPSYVYDGTYKTTLTAFRQTLQAWLDDKAGTPGVYELKWEENAEEGPLYAVETDGVAGEYMYKSNYYYQDGSKKVYITGKKIKDLLGLRSHAITADYNAETDELVLHTKGWGHGVGMSQFGAIGYANEEGWTYDQILRHYYSITDTTPYQLVGPNW